MVVTPHRLTSHLARWGAGDRHRRTGVERHTRYRVGVGKQSHNTVILVSHPTNW